MLRKFPFSKFPFCKQLDSMGCGSACVKMLGREVSLFGIRWVRCR